MIEITKLNILIPVWLTLSFIQGHSCMINQNFPNPFSINLERILYVATTCWFVELLIICFA